MPAIYLGKVHAMVKLYLLHMVIRAVYVPCLFVSSVGIDNACLDAHKQSNLLKDSTKLSLNPQMWFPFYSSFIITNNVNIARLLNFMPSNYDYFTLRGTMWAKSNAAMTGIEIFRESYPSTSTNVHLTLMSGLLKVKST